MRFPGPGVVLGVALTAVCLGRLSAAPSKGDEIVARAADYVAGFVRRFSTIVVEERFVQDARRIGGTARTGAGRNAGSIRDKEVVAAGVAVHRELVSDYLLVKSPDLGEWHTFRDVLEVDGRTVRDRTQRLTALFLESAPAAEQRAAEIDREGIRYNLGDPSRSINNPLLVLGFLQAPYRSRFKFSLRDPDPELGPDVWTLEYREQARPTILRRLPDGDLAARGRLWIEARTGRVLRTELTVSDDDEITVSFRFDDRFQIAVPIEMREHYWNGNEYVEGIARYDHFREFAVRTEEKIQTEQTR